MNPDDVNIYFIIPRDYVDESDCDDGMKGTFDLCRSHVKKCSWIREQNWKQISKTKQDVVVFQEFEGDVFKTLVEEKCLILGYRCLKTCLLEKIPIPNCPTPVYTISMTNMIVCCSGIPPAEKKNLQLKIGYMGGLYSPSFTKQTTHLVTDCVNSVKYAWAVELKIPVYLSSWVDAVWEENLSNTMFADDPIFDKHKCPPFYKLNVTSTGLSKKERDSITTLINNNGGSYSGKFQSEFTKVLICRKGAASEKYYAAKKSKIDCCTMDWVSDSAKLGYALPFDKYRIMDKDFASSTLNNPNETVGLNFSMASTIQGDSRDISESRLMNSSTISSILPFKGTPKTGNNEDNTHTKVDSIMQNLPELREIKKIGPFLDGCCVYLAGFPVEQREKLCKILNLGGAIRYDTISGHVTHLIAQDYSTSEIEKFHEEGHSPIALSLEWIIESIKLKCPAPEEPYKLNPTKSKNTDSMLSPSSPLSKKGVQMLRTNSSASISKNNDSVDKEDEMLTTGKENPVFGTENENDFMKEYFQKRHSGEPDTLDQFLAGGNLTEAEQAKTLKNNESDTIVKDNLPLPRQSHIEQVAPLPVDDSTSHITDVTGSSDIFEGIKFSIVDWDETSEEQIAEIITNCGGEVVKNSRDKVDYAIVPLEGVECELNAREIVTNLWVEECFNDNKLYPVKYYHKPVTLSKEDAAPLKGCVITLSSYKNYERSFIIWLIQYLGASAEEMLSKKDNKKGVPASTHLICPAPMGSKYTAAVRWGLYTVTEDWLLACAAECKHIPENLYTVKESPLKDNTKTDSVSNENNASTSRPSNIVNNQNNSTIVENIDELNKDNESSNKTNEHITPKTSKVNEKKKHPLDDFFSTTSTKTTESKNETPKRVSSPLPVVDLEDTNFSLQNTSKNQSMNANNKRTPKSDSFLSEKQSSSDSQFTPLQQRFSKLFPDTKNNSPFVEPKSKTPIHLNKLTNINSPIGLSQPMTPVAKFFENLGLPKNSTPDNSPLPLTPSHVVTPETPLGRCFGNPNPSPETRKYWAKRINALPSYHHTPPSKRPRLNSTPLSELKERLWRKILPADYEENIETGKTEDAQQENCSPVEKVLTPTKNPLVSAQVQQLKVMLQRRASEEGLRRSLVRTEERQCENEEPTLTRMPVESQSETIGWEDPLEADNHENLSPSVHKPESSFILPRRFMLSQIPTTDRQKYIELIESVGGIISDQITLFDEASTHLICPTLSRNEKMLASVAAGKWVLHTSYLEDSAKAGHFLNEELYEYGNPLATSLTDIPNPQIAAAVFRWRTKISETKQRAYHGMRAIIFVKSRKDQLIRLIEAGGGTVINDVSCDEDLDDATHCFVDPKQLNDFPQTKFLASKGVFCLPPIYLSNVLISDPPLNPKDCIIPNLLSYYK
ncbi:DNA topoisomerase 2-binding protein 1 isoform X2 [Chrysoperla carnea]|uniref:DNA topoisomerase 2-binding protein 1 isoform X2 n=1 Tax=Chrysoperla carnea TaxID=189513 RepID=UPI001D069570|nr:DNA topoisomerase 2-binding protein 1 isoform X2 [Chrysoperla carnea]